MSLRPIRSRRRWNRRSSYGQLQARQNWKPWKGWSQFHMPSTNPRHPKRNVMVFLSLILLIGVFSINLVTTPHASKPLIFQTSPDPVVIVGTRLWHSAMPNSGLGEYNTVPTVISVNCSNFETNMRCISLQSNSTNPAIALTKDPIDLSSSAGNMLALSQLWKGNGPPIQDIPFGWYLTTNKTISLDRNYSPLADSQVVFYSQLICTASCGGTATMANVIFMVKNIGDTIAQEDTFACTGSAFLCNTQNYSPVNNAGNLNFIYLNFTGFTNTPPTVNCNTSPALAGSGCSFSQNIACGCPSQNNVVSTTFLPWLHFHITQLYLGFYIQNTSGGGNMGVNWGTDNLNDDFCCGIKTISLQQLGYAQNTGGLFGPLLDALKAGAIFIFNAVIATINYIRPALMSAWNVIEGWISQALNILGGILGYPTLGTDLIGFINQLFQFFTNLTYGLPAAFLQFPTLFTQFLNWLQIVFPILTPAFTLASAITAFGVNGVSLLITIFTVGLQLILFGYAMILIFSFFIFTGDDSLGGLFTYIGTAQALAFKIVNVIILLVNYGIDILVHIISLIPKPFIQMYAGKFPRLPLIETTATITWPSLDFAELRSGNLFVVWLWTIGFYFDVWYESRNPSLPGTVAALVPGTAVNMQKLASMLPLLQIFVLIAGGGLLFWLVMRPIQMMGQDLGIFEEFSAGPGRRSGPGPSGFRVKRGQKHELGFVQRRATRAVGLRAAAKAEVEE